MKQMLFLVRDSDYDRSQPQDDEDEELISLYNGLDSTENSGGSLILWILSKQDKKAQQCNADVWLYDLAGLVPKEEYSFATQIESTVILLSCSEVDWTMEGFHFRQHRNGK